MTLAVVGRVVHVPLRMQAWVGKEGHVSLHELPMKDVIACQVHSKHNQPNFVGTEGCMASMSIDIMP